MPVNNTGIQTKVDDLAYQFDEEKINMIVSDFKDLDLDELRSKYSRTDSSGWTFLAAKNDLQTNRINFRKVLYHPFDFRVTAFTGTAGGFMGRPRTKESQHLIFNNLAFLCIRNSRRGNVNNYFIANCLVDKDGISPFDNCKFFPLYLYSETQPNELFATQTRTSNFSPEIVARIADHLQLRFEPEKTAAPDAFAPIDVLDYIYAVLHSPSYREKYKEFLKIDFPRVPYPKDAATFWQLVTYGGALRALHLLESPKLDDFVSTYHSSENDNVVRALRYDDGRVYINPTAWFEGVPEAAWTFYIGGYQPAQKWLKDRKNRPLGFEDVLHYQRILVALIETARIMQEIDGLAIE